MHLKSIGKKLFENAIGAVEEYGDDQIWVSVICLDNPLDEEKASKMKKVRKKLMRVVGAEKLQWGEEEASIVFPKDKTKLAVEILKSWQQI